VRELLELSDIFAFPSLCAEGLPVAMIEAMASRKPCVGWRVNPNEEIIEDGHSGLLVEPGNVDAFANALCELAADREKLKCMGHHAYTIASSKFDLDRASKQLESFYLCGLNGVTQKRKGPSSTSLSLVHPAGCLEKDA
jgi:glycosyltransferase involved in cell wall biosynthesis